MDIIKNYINKTFLITFLITGLILFDVIYGFNLKVNPINSLDLIEKYQDQDRKPKNVFSYPMNIDQLEQFKLIQTDKDQNFIVLGARNKIITINSNEKIDKTEIYESYFPANKYSSNDRNCTEKNCANYVLTAFPINKNEFNVMFCGTYYGLFQCIQASQNKLNGFIDSFNSNNLLKAPKSITKPISNQNAYYLSEMKDLAKNEYFLYVASSWTDTSQYLAIHSSQNNYQEENLNKKIGFSKSFIKFVDDDKNNKLFLFQNEHSYDVDDGEKDRDILISTSLVSQICKTNENELNKETIFYSELTAKIYCFNDAFRTNSGNSRNFKFDSLDFITDLMDLKDSQSNNSKKLFYGVFNTPRNQITGTAICFFDINDLSNVFQKQNFKYLDNNNDNNAKNSVLNPQDCSSELNYMDKIKHKSFTSKLSYMTKSVLPIRKRKASFIATNDYRLTCLYVINSDLNQYNMHPSIKFLSDKYQYMNIIFAGTDNGKLMRIAHYFSDSYFKNDEYDEEHVKILEEIQLFNKDTPINEIKILNTGSKTNQSKRLFAISSKQVKSISLDFCELLSESCEQCLKNNNAENNKYYNSKCYWINDKCKSGIDLNIYSSQSIYLSKLETCQNMKKNQLPFQPTQKRISTTTILTRQSTQLMTTVQIKSIYREGINATGSLYKVLADPHENLRSADNISKPILLNVHKNEIDKLLTPSNEIVGSKLLTENEIPESTTNKYSTTFLILILIASLVALIIGMMIGFIVKEKYSRKLFNNMSLNYQTNKKSLNVIGDLNASNKSPNELIVDDKLVKYIDDQSKKVRIARNNQHLEYNNQSNLSNISKSCCNSTNSGSLNDDESFSSTKITNTTSSHNANCICERSVSCFSKNSYSYKESSDSNNSDELKVNKLRRNEKEPTSYFTVQKDYSILSSNAKLNISNNKTFTNNYIKTNVFKLESTNSNSQNTINSKSNNKRLSLTSTSLDSTSYTTSITAANNHMNNHNNSTSLINSQTCLLNNLNQKNKYSKANIQNESLISNERNESVLSRMGLSTATAVPVSTTMNNSSSFYINNNQNNNFSNENCMIVDDETNIDDIDDVMPGDQLNYSVTLAEAARLRLRNGITKRSSIISSLDAVTPQMETIESSISPTNWSSNHFPLASSCSSNSTGSNYNNLLQQNKLNDNKIEEEFNYKNKLKEFQANENDVIKKNNDSFYNKNNSYV